MSILDTNIDEVNDIAEEFFGIFDYAVQQILVSRISYYTEDNDTPDHWITVNLKFHTVNSRLLPVSHKLDIPLRCDEEYIRHNLLQLWTNLAKFKYKGAILTGIEVTGINGPFDLSR